MNYQKEALRTESTVSGLEVSATVVNTLSLASVFILIGEKLVDAAKREIFYGKPAQASKLIHLVSPILDGALVQSCHRYVHLVLADEEGAAKTHFAVDSVESLRLLHGSLGIVTEASELFAAIVNKQVSRMVGAEVSVDRTNVLEELGDLSWHIALIQAVLGVTDESVKAANIAKLRVRFPDKFTQEAAAGTRNVEEEQRAVREKTS